MWIQHRSLRLLNSRKYQLPLSPTSTLHFYTRKQTKPNNIHQEMAQSKPKLKIQETQEGDSKTDNASKVVPFKFNAQAPEFVPMSHTQMPVSGYFYPCYQYQLGGSSGSDWIYVGDHQDSIPLASSTEVMIPNYSRDVLNEDLQQKIIRQVEYQFSGLSLLANDSLVKQINKDQEGYVPISVIASTKKIKSLINNNHLLAQTLRSSSKLVVSEDGKKVRRKHPFTEKEKEDLQSRTVVAENLPEDHSHQNLEKMFSVVGSVKNIRICHPQESNSPRTKGDFVICNKLHALVEYETTEMAEKAVDKLNDERNWRKGLRVRLLVRCSPKSVLKPRKPEFDWCFDDEDESPSLESLEDFCQRNNYELAIDASAEESSVGSRKGGSWRGRAKPGLPRSQSRNGRSPLSPALQSVQCEASSSPRQISKGPRMPDGTRGFTMGRGKPICTL